MKYNVKHIASIVLIIATLYSCNSDDKIVDKVLEQVTSGAVLRTKDIKNNMVYNAIDLKFTTGSNYTVTMEEQDVTGGELLSSVDILARFVENTQNDTNGDGLVDDKDENLSTEEGIIRTLSPADFNAGENGFPITAVTFTADELVNFTKIDVSKIEGKDEFALRMVLKLTDGRSFSVDDANGNVADGSFFSSPYTYRTPIACEITESLAGTYTYIVTSLQAAPGGKSKCDTTDLPSGMVIWKDTKDAGKYNTTDISFGQFNNCYGVPGGTFKTIDFTNAIVNWNCTNLVADESILVDEDESTEAEFSYVYTITKTAESNMTIDFSNSAGDRGTVILTRADNKVWPDLLKRMEQ